jgi:hypothetical protein
MKTTLSVNGPPSSEKKKTRSRSEPGKTASIAPGDRDGSTASLTKPQTPDSIPPLNSVILNLIQNLVFLVFDLNQERGTDPRSVTKNRLSSANGETLNGQPVSFALKNPYLPPPTTVSLKLYNSHLGTCNRSFLRTENCLTDNDFSCTFLPPTCNPNHVFS